MENIKPISTEYNGYLFRSRLEARWAVFFDSIGIRYEYEPEGFVFQDGTKYLPDFYLPDCKQFFEVKGVMSDKDEHKIECLIRAGYYVTIGYAEGRFDACNNYKDWGAEEWYPYPGESYSMLCKCNKCGGYWFMGSDGSYVCQCCGYYDGDGGFTNEMNERDTKLWDVARRARFEHGETPNT